MAENSWKNIKKKKEKPSDSEAEGIFVDNKKLKLNDDGVVVESEQTTKKLDPKGDFSNFPEI